MNFQKGFTLIEILVVMAIVTLLSSAIFASASSAREKARFAGAKEFASKLDQSLGSDVIGGWPLNEGAGTTVRDSMGGSNTGILYNGETFSSDTPLGDGKSLLLNGINHYIDIPENSDGVLKYKGGDFTVAAWIKPDLTEVTAGKIISKPWNGSGQYNYTLERAADGTIIFSLYGATFYSLSSTAITKPGVWSHVAASINSSNDVAIYIDGKRVAFGTHAIASWTPPAGDLGQSVAIGTLYPYGAWAGNTAFSFGGLIDEPRIFAATILK